jgi:hypothetical protein
MTNKELTDLLLKTIKDKLRSDARLKAIETVLVESFPPAQRAGVSAKLDAREQEWLQKILEYYEDHDPALGGLLDGRSFGEMDKLE